MDEIQTSKIRGLGNINEKSCVVAPPKERNRATFGHDNATEGATDYATYDIKAIAHACYKRLQRNQWGNFDATEGEKQRNFYPVFTPPKVALVAETNQRIRQESGKKEKELLSEDWAYSERIPPIRELIQRIGENCPLLPDDKPHIEKGLLSIPAKWHVQLAVKYIETWHQAHAAETKEVKKENAGRRAANMIITNMFIKQRGQRDYER